MIRLHRGRQAGERTPSADALELTRALDGLSAQEADQLLEGIRLPAGGRQGRSAHRIRRTVVERTGTAAKRRPASHWKRGGAAAAAVLASLLLTLSLVGFDTTAMALQRLFRLIPGLGISDTGAGQAYVALPVADRIQEGNRSARLLHAFYSGGWLQLSVKLEDSPSGGTMEQPGGGQLAAVAAGSPIEPTCRLWIGGEEAEGVQIRQVATLSQVQVELCCPMEPEDLPSEDTLYEVQVEGLSQKLAFRLTPCQEAADLSQLGAVEEQDGIAVAALASIQTEGLEVSCYPVALTEERGYASIRTGSDGMAYAGGDVWLEVDGRRIEPLQEGIQRRNTYLFPAELSQGQKPVLHIPYLTVKTQEERQLTLPLPQEEGSAALNLTADFSGGRLQLTGIQRETDPYTGELSWKLTVRLTGSEEGMLFQSLSADILDRQGNLVERPSLSYDEEGFLTTLWLGDTDADQIQITFRQPSYFFVRDYAIPLELTGS